MFKTGITAETTDAMRSLSSHGTAGCERGPMEMRALDTAEIDAVAGGNAVIAGLLLCGFLAGFDLGISGAAEEIFKPIDWKRLSQGKI